MGIKTLYYQLTGPDKYRTVKTQGLTLCVRYSETVGKNILKRGCWEKEQLTYLVALISKTQTTIFLDIGSYFGYYSLYLARHAALKKIIAIEASPSNFHDLQRHVKLNHLEDKIETLNIGVSQEKATLPYLINQPMNPGSSGIQDYNDAPHDPEKFSKIYIDTMPLDELFHFTGEKIAVKMDIEGHEYFAFKGAEKLFKSNRIILQVEIFPDNLPKSRNLLGEYGYKLIHQIEHDYYFSNYAELQVDVLK